MMSGRDDIHEGGERPGPLGLGDLRSMIRAARVRTFAPGALLCREGTIGDSTFLVRRGTVEVFKTSRGRQRTLAYRRSGDVVGEMALFEERRRTASARAVEPVRALVLHASRAREMLEAHPRLAVMLLEMMSHRLRRVQQELLDELMARVEDLEEANEHLEARVAQRTHELRESNAALERMAVSDYLTSCYNRRWLMQDLEKRCASGDPLGVVLMDVDHFKHYNDHNGHLAGDDLLRRFVRILQSQVRPQDVVARYGGEEFVVLVAGAGRDVAQEAAERIRARVAAEAFLHGSTQPLGRVTLTAGVATLPEDGTEPEALLHRADERLYQGKEAGRNRVQCG